MRKISLVFAANVLCVCVARKTDNKIENTAKSQQPLHQRRMKMKTNRCNGVRTIFTHDSYKVSERVGILLHEKKRKKNEEEKKNTWSVFLCFVQFAIHLTANLRTSNATYVCRSVFLSPIYLIYIYELLYAFMVIFGQMHTEMKTAGARDLDSIFCSYCALQISVHLLQFCQVSISTLV